MIVDVSGVILIPGNGGKDCPGNGEHNDEKGNRIPCCCDECDYMICCYEGCIGAVCEDEECPLAQKEKA